MDKVRLAYDEASVHLNKIAALFTGEVKITLLVRHPGKDEQDFLLTNDDLEEVNKGIERAKNRADYGREPQREQSPGGKNG